MRYPVEIKPDGEGWMVSFPDIPEALTSGATQEEALAMAKDALETALDFYFDDKREVPAPSRLKRGQPVIELSASLSAKVLLLNEMVRQKIRPAELARRLHTTAQEVNRLTDIRHTTRIDGIAAALQALGRRLDIRVV
ncbi:MAG: type II toxin-antitoxin system HicB family antitoxin [Gammaproteobacteria bacterium]